MPRRLARFPWLVLPFLALFSACVLADSPEGAAQALQLLGQIGMNYPASVAAGVVVDEPRYRDQLELTAQLQALVLALPVRDQSPSLEQDARQLHEAIAQRRPGDQVERQAHTLAERLAERYEISRSPAIRPDPARGEPLYAQQCAVCHGDLGHGDGPAGLGLEPAPSNLADRARLDRQSLFDLFNTIGLGIDGSDMPGFADQLDERQRWDLATYIAHFTAEPSLGTGAPFELSSLAVQTPAQIERSEGVEAAERFRAQRAQPPAVKRGPQQLLDYTRQTLDKSLQAYRGGDHEQAYDLSVAAYLEGFELVESALDNLDSGLRKRTERALMAFRQSLLNGITPDQAAAELAALQPMLAECADLLGGDDLNASLSFLSALLILLREGVEAILVLAAILAFLRNTGQQAALRSVHIGWGLAVLAGIATWAAAAYLIDVSGAQRELMEGVTALFASAVLLWVGVWMHDRRHVAAWQSTLQAQLEGGRGRFGFAMLAFFAVYRELFEVILFYETLWLQAGPAGHAWVIGGAVAALVLLVGLAWVILRGAQKLPLSTFFSANAILLCVLSVVFAGHGVVALQEAGVFATRPVPFFEVDLLGIHPDAWSLLAQGIALTGVAVLYGRSWLIQKRAASAAA
ncbi:FTR1 family protein [Stutzerimonas azotifigens]|uniref:C-type cytochrome n=1 Tax=Stutzerimonas azotifigens TaxID=291995 RepID=A0ABR5YZ33_9GAMM|nr:FTR1 family protein [Stutzerimonas azotifigens]MBA1273171.1 c-type cytochrome [Stutzerimonas azotifigens]